MLKRALGYNYTEETIETLVDGSEKYKTVTKHMAGDITAQIFWLKNRRPDKWKDKNIIEHEGELKTEDPFKGLTTEELKKVIFSGEK